jgi:L-cysteine desulfidase
MTPRDAIRLLQSEIVQVVGCTEPAAIAYAFRTLVRHLPVPPGPDSLIARLQVSRDAFRNASTAVVPQLKLPGILAAAAAGCASRADDFNVFADFDLKLARRFMKNGDWLRVVPVRRNGLFVALRFNADTGIVLSGRHNHIAQLVVHGRDLTPREISLPPAPKLDEIFALARARHPKLEALALDFITRQVPPEKGFPLNEQIARRIAGRMAGYAHPVMTLTGSGNQGIFIALPYRHLYAKQGDTILPALVFSLLAQVHLSHKHKRLSADCGLATKAAPALAAGLAFARGASPADIRRLFREIPARLAGLACEGAEPACGGKARQALRAVGSLPFYLALAHRAD